MRAFCSFVTILTFGFLLSFCSSPNVRAQSGEIFIVYSGNTLGELKPCGCSREEDQGGIERRATYLKKIRATQNNVLLLDTGDSFDQPTQQGKIKASYLMQSLSIMNYSAIMLGDKDLVYGKDFLKNQEGIPWVGSNYKIDGLPLPRYQIKSFKDGLKVAILAVGDPELFYSGSGEQMAPVEETVHTLVAELQSKEQPDLIVLMTHMQREKSLSFLETPGIDVIINGNIEKATDVIDTTPVEKSGKIFVQSGTRGQKMGELKIQISTSGDKSFSQKMIPLGSAFEFDAEMTALYEKYNEEIETLFFETMTARRSKTQTKIYAGENVCKTCHAQSHETWTQSRHGHAYATLKKVNKAFDPECLACHVVGFNQPGGFVSELDTPDLENVQCENCHGPGLQHSKLPKAGFGAQANKACNQCHVKNHSPKFNFSTYWPKIKH
ncbi:MAG: hypothetical protein COV66_06460 [Nitrospinae bacterium CG11_big_fil_rev_8_21_14_0_20_45_15]|nr:MAG: hypothetical protein COV66_06460 [Nitrospinae bacterium CG11_big_fil_rev_8_21_14_0_20_45_15]